MHYYKFNIADYRKDTTHLTMLEHGIYRTLIDQYYLDEKPVCLDVDQLSRKMRLTTEDELKSLKMVLFDFFERTEKGHKHRRINVDILGYHELATKNAANGKLGGRPPKTQTVMGGNPNESDPKGNHKPLTIKPVTSKKKEYPTPDGVDASVWQDFLQISKAKKSPMTATALKGIEREAGKAGMTLSEAITSCCELGWARFNAGWYAERMAKKVNNVVGVESFRERDQKAKRAQMERDFPNLVNPQEKNNVPSLTLG